MKKKKEYSEKLHWKVHVPNILKEIVECSGQEIYRIPLNVLQSILAQVADRAIELNDTRLNILMCRLCLYEQADPHSKEHNPNIIDELEKQLKKELKDV